MNNQVVLSTRTHLHIIITFADILHSWAISSLGVKCDVVPGHLNQTSNLIKWEGITMVSALKFVVVVHISTFKLTSVFCLAYIESCKVGQRNWKHQYENIAAIFSTVCSLPHLFLP